MKKMQKNSILFKPWKREEILILGSCMQLREKKKYCSPPSLPFCQHSERRRNKNAQRTRAEKKNSMNKHQTRLQKNAAHPSKASWDFKARPFHPSFSKEQTQSSP